MSEPTEIRHMESELARCNEEAKEEQYPEPNRKAIENARFLMHGMYHTSPYRYEVMPDADGGIIIQAGGVFGCSVMLVCENGGEIKCWSNVDGERSTKVYHTVRGLPDRFISDELNKLADMREKQK